MDEINYTKATDCIEWKWPDFQPKEFACKCCGNLIFNEDVSDTWNKLQKFRDIVNCPVIINSAYRCEKHNDDVGGAKNSYHKKGVAFDIKIYGKLSRQMIHNAAECSGFTGIGDYDSFVHIDTGRTRYWDLRS